MTSFAHAPRSLFLFALTAGVFSPALGCHTQAAEEPAVTAAASSPDLQLEPGGRKIQYLKFAEAVIGGAGNSAASTGKIAFDEDHTSRVGSPLSGRVESLLVKPGDVVKKGQALLTIVSPEVESAIADERAAAAEVSLQTRNLERVRALLADQAIAHKEVSQAESDLTKAQAGQLRARARLALLGLSTNDHSSRFTLRAPLAGTVVERAALPGAEVRSDAGTPLVTISELSRVWVVVDIYEKNLAAVREGQKAEVTVASYPGEVFPAQIEHVGDVVDAQTRTVKVRLVADNPDHKLKPEMFARVALPLAGPAAAVTVPANAVLSDGEANVVMVAMADGKFAKRRVEIGAESEGRLAVLSGLRPGERVVVDGALFLKAELENR
jgi:cobalt-zinc-cadmium efflux system membrane fusion protein